MPKVSISRESLRRAHSDKLPEIRKALKGFVRAGKRPETEIFLELVFCLLTPQSRARASESAIKKLRERGFPEKALSPDEIRKCLAGVRFPNNKAKYVFLARKLFSDSSGKVSVSPFLPLSDPFLSREFLVKNVLGLGMKEASHFLRNIGHGADLAILDIHVLRRLGPLGLVREMPRSIPPKNYLELEAKLAKFSRRIGIPLAELDLVLWSDGTGEIFK